MNELFRRRPYLPDPDGPRYDDACWHAMHRGSTHPAKFAHWVIDHCPRTMPLAGAWAAAPHNVKALPG